MKYMYDVTMMQYKQKLWNMDVLQLTHVPVPMNNSQANELNLPQNNYIDKTLPLTLNKHAV